MKRKYLKWWKNHKFNVVIGLVVGILLGNLILFGWVVKVNNRNVENYFQKDYELSLVGNAACRLENYGAYKGLEVNEFDFLIKCSKADIVVNFDDDFTLCRKVWLDGRVLCEI